MKIMMKNIPARLKYFLDAWRCIRSDLLLTINLLSATRSKSKMCGKEKKFRQEDLN